METGAIEEANQEDEPDVKVILLGDSAVGKSKLVERFLDDEYQPRRVNFFFSIVNSNIVSLNILDPSSFQPFFH